MVPRWRLVLLFLAAFIAGGWVLGPVLTYGPAGWREGRMFGHLVATIHAQFIEDVPTDSLYRDAARHVVASLRDPYAELLLGSRLRAYDLEMSGHRDAAMLGDPAAGPRVSAVTREALLAHGVGYVELGTITEGAASDLAAAVERLRSRGMRSLLLDLRMNPGGLIEEGVGMARLFLPAGDTIAILRGRGPGHDRVYTASDPARWRGLRLTLLVNRGTASTAELLTAALQSHHRAAVVGGRTFGKGIVQTTYRLGDDAAVKLTTARWFTPDGRSVQRSPALDSVGTGGLDPDVLIRRARPAGGDLALLMAMDGHWEAFQDTLCAVARRLSHDGGIQSENFAVTQRMRDRLFGALAAAGLLTDRQIFDDGNGLVDRQLGAALARAAFGEAAAIRREATSDTTLSAGLALAAGAH